MLVLKDRELSKSGISLLSHEEAARRISETGTLEPHFKVYPSTESKEYRLIYGEDIDFNPFYDEIDAPRIVHSHEEMDELLEILETSPRFESKFVDRLTTEIDFFERTHNIKFLLALHDMICQFKKDNVVWGVGRGSSVSSLVLYLLEVHDINPITYGIPFYELSKEN